MYYEFPLFSTIWHWISAANKNGRQKPMLSLFPWCELRWEADLPDVVSNHNTCDPDTLFCCTTLTSWVTVTMMLIIIWVKLNHMKDVTLITSRLRLRNVLMSMLIFSDAKLRMSVREAPPEGENQYVCPQSPIAYSIHSTQCTVHL